jgi:hypothetical protein
VETKTADRKMRNRKMKEIRERTMVERKMGSIDKRATDGSRI